MRHRRGLPHPARRLRALLAGIAVLLAVLVGAVTTGTAPAGATATNCGYNTGTTVSACVTVNGSGLYVNYVSIQFQNYTSFTEDVSYQWYAQGWPCNPLLNGGAYNPVTIPAHSTVTKTRYYTATIPAKCAVGAYISAGNVFLVYVVVSP